MLKLGLPVIVAVAPPSRRRWTATGGPQPIFFPGIQSPIGWRTRRSRRVRSPSASLDVDPEIDGAGLTTGGELRFELDRLQAEAESTRSKANGARMRLIRLSEVAEQLQKQAASKVKAGKENDARELLLQKKNIVLALEKSKNRAELLDKLSAKLNEAILLKETELIGSVSLHSSLSVDDTDSPVRVVPLRIVQDEKSQENEACESLDSNSEKVQDLEPEQHQISNAVESAAWHVEEKPNADTLNTGMGTSMASTTYKDFIKHVDGQLEGLQDDLLSYLRFSSLVTENQQTERNKNFQDILEILQDISSLRKRIVKVIQSQ